MTAPSKNWTDIADTSIAADKPLSTTLMTQIRDDLAFLKDWMGGAYAANATNPHTHDGVNSAFVASVADASITTSKIVDANVTLVKLKMAQGSYSIGVNPSYGLYDMGIANPLVLPNPVPTSQTYKVKGWVSDGNSMTPQYSNFTISRYSHYVGGYASNGYTGTFVWDYHTN